MPDPAAPTAPASAPRPGAPTRAADLDFRPRGPVHPSPADWRDVTLYQVLIDRFDDNRDRPPYAAGRTATGRDPRQGRAWQGGNLKGLARRLDYIAGLGVGCIWVSSPLRQRTDADTYHGYAPQHFLDVDPRFGTTQEFAELVGAAHGRGLYVVMDIVVDHTGDLWRYAPGQGAAGREHPTYDNGRRYAFGAWNRGDPAAGFAADEGVWPSELQDPEAFVRRGDIVDFAALPGPEIRDGDFMGLKKLDLLNPRVLGAIVNCYKYWIAVADVDGFRIDVLKHVQPRAASDFVHAIREYALSIGKRNFLQVGEVISTERELHRYVGNNVELHLELAEPDEGQAGEAPPAASPPPHLDYPHLDAVLDHSLQSRLVPVVRGAAAGGTLDELAAGRKRVFRDLAAAGAYFVSYLENHDVGAQEHRRLLNGTTGRRPPGYDRPGGDPRLAVMGYAVLLCGTGVPCLYYGTEQGFDGGPPERGGGDFYVREAMFGGTWGPFDTTGAAFFDESHPIYVATAALNAIRRQQPALRYGRHYPRPISGDGEHFGPPRDAGAPFAFARVLDVTEVVVVANPSLEARELCVAVDGALNPPGAVLRDLMDEPLRVTVERRDAAETTFVRIAIGPRAARILRQVT